MDTNYDVILFGSYFCDLIFTGLPDVPRLGTDIFSSGFDMVAGAGFRTVLAFHRLGLRVGWPVDFGNDLFSRFVLEEVRRAGVDEQLFRHHPFPVRAVSVSFSFSYDRGFISYVDPVEEVDPAQIIEQHRPRWVLITYLAYGPDFERLAAAARRAGTRILMDCQYGEATLATPGVIDSLRTVDVFAPNESEALRVTGATDLDTALARLSDFSPVTVVKCGANGAYATAGGQIVHAPALKVEVRDTTGAGDCFNAGFLYGYMRGEPLQRCLQIGNICGGLSITTTDIWRLPTITEVQERLDG